MKKYKELKDFECKMSSLYGKKAIASRKSRLKKTVEISCSGDFACFSKKMLSRAGYLDIIDKINNSRVSDKIKSNYINAINVYKLVYGIDYKNDKYKVKSLLSDYSKIILSILNYRDIIRSGNVVGEYAEYLCETFLNITRTIKDTKDFDGEKDGLKFQIKSRWIHSGNKGEDEFGQIRINPHTGKPYFDYFIGMIFDKDLVLSDCYIIDSNNISILYKSLKRKTLKIRKSDLVDSSNNPKHGIIFETKFDAEVSLMKKFTK